MMADSDAKKTCTVPITDEKPGDAPGLKNYLMRRYKALGILQTSQHLRNHLSDAMAHTMLMIILKNVTSKMSLR